MDSVPQDDAVKKAVDESYATRREEEARAAVQTILKSRDWAAWLKYGDYCAEGRTECMAFAGTNEPVGLKYNKAMNAWLAERPWITDIDKVSRSHAVWCWEHREELEKLRAALGSNAQKKNHPTTMWSYWKAQQRLSQKEPKKVGASKADIEQQLTLMTDDRDKWRKKAEAADALFDVKNDPVKVIVPIIANEVSQNKLGELAKALKAEFDRRSKIKNGAK